MNQDKEVSTTLLEEIARLDNAINTLSQKVDFAEERLNMILLPSETEVSPKTSVCKNNGSPLAIGISDRADVIYDIICKMERLISRINV